MLVDMLANVRRVLCGLRRGPVPCPVGTRINERAACVLCVACTEYAHALRRVGHRV
jgi:hypothetical protein